MDRIAAASRLFESPTRTFAVRLWDGTRLPPGRDEGVPGELVLSRPEALAALAPPVVELNLAEAYLDGDLELEGDAIALLEAASLWEGPRLTLTLLPAVAGAVAQRMERRPWRRFLPGIARTGAFPVPLGRPVHSLARDRSAVQHHYDVSDEFYRLFLDPDLVYSCAYFATGRESLEDAQRAKLDLVCRKLALRPGDRFLDIGCGWGSLVAHASARYGVDAIGITLSEHQLAEAHRRFAAPDGPRVEIRGADYRRLDPEERFDKVASVGMMEHVGRKRLGDYFSAIERHLVPGGLFLNHAIADTSRGELTLPWTSRRGGAGFIARYIFPDGDLVPLRDVIRAAERAGFEVRDVESLREHYAETLAAWLGRLEANRAAAEQLVGVRRTRIYRLYLASSAAAFRVGRIGVYQMLLAKRTSQGRTKDVPRCRGEWYEPVTAPAARAATTEP